MNKPGIVVKGGACNHSVRRTVTLLGLNLDGFPCLFALEETRRERSGAYLREDNLVQIIPWRTRTNGLLCASCDALEKKERVSILMHRDDCKKSFKHFPCYDVFNLYELRFFHISIQWLEGNDCENTSFVQSESRTTSVNPNIYEIKILSTRFTARMLVRGNTLFSFWIESSQHIWVCMWIWLIVK